MTSSTSGSAGVRGPIIGIVLTVLVTLFLTFDTVLKVANGASRAGHD